ncbi:MAG: protein kinase, partial [Planctomycetota bacterium]|nr:protein kinase [Planctomycetota bacterium]
FVGPQGPDLSEKFAALEAPLSLDSIATAAPEDIEPLQPMPPSIQSHTPPGGSFQPPPFSSPNSPTVQLQGRDQQGFNSGMPIANRPGSGPQAAVPYPHSSPSGPVPIPNLSGSPSGANQRIDPMASPPSGRFQRPPGMEQNPWPNPTGPTFPNVPNPAGQTFPNVPNLGSPSPFRPPSPSGPFPVMNPGQASPFQPPPPFPAPPLQQNPNFQHPHQSPPAPFPAMPFPSPTPPGNLGPQRPSTGAFPIQPDLDNAPASPFGQGPKTNSGGFPIMPPAQDLNSPGQYQNHNFQGPGPNAPGPGSGHFQRPQSGAYAQQMPEPNANWQNPPTPMPASSPFHPPPPLPPPSMSPPPMLPPPMATPIGPPPMAVPAPMNMPAPILPPSKQTEPPPSILGGGKIDQRQQMQAIPAAAMNSQGMIPADLEATEITGTSPQGYPFGKYTLFEELGRGASGCVYKSTHPEYKVTVAIKILSDDLVRDKRAVKRFVREGEIMTGLNHENIVRVYDYGEVDKRYYLVMDYVAGHSLDWHLQAGRLKTDRALRILECICHAGDHAHSKGVVHRDLKPENILLTEEDKPLLTDFGLAKGEELGLTQSGTAVGTPYFMSPEQIQGQKDVDSRADVYSMGVIAYRLLTGKLPFRAKSAYELYNKVLNSEPKPPTRLNKRLNGDFDVVVMKAIKKDRKDRYQSLADFADDLSDLRLGKKPSHGGRKVSRRMRSWWKK